MEKSSHPSESNQENKWNVDLFSEKIINPDLISPKMGDVSRVIRDFEWEKNLKEYEPVKNEAQRWLGKAHKIRVKKLAKKLLLNKATQFKKPLANFPDYHFPPNSKPQMFAVGQSHLDVGYRWRYLQTTEKIRITAAKACLHIDEVPEFSFSSSQPVMLEWTMHKDPALFERIQRAVKTGRFELVGGSYVEPDTHLISGESWCRQRLYGQLFYKKYFDQYAEIEWVPDSFGFTSTIPQFVVKSGGKYFFTKKMYWNDSTCFPFSVFWWQSPDGSRLLTRSVSGYQRKGLHTEWEKYASTALLLKPEIDNSDITFNYESEGMDNYLAAPPFEYFSHEMIPYGIFLYGQSDGGHGPRGVEVQTHLAMHNMGYITLSPAIEYFRKVEAEFDNRLPVWEDEMYLEYHRGTYTTSPLLKRMNRYFEWLLPAIEKLAVFTMLNTDAEFPQAAFDECWKFTLLQQFHDVLPGSNVPELLDDCWAVWDTQKEKVAAIMQYLWMHIDKISMGLFPETIRKILKTPEDVISIQLFNPTSYEINARVNIPVEDFSVPIDCDKWIILTKDGNPIALTPSASVSCGKRFYEIPSGISFQMPNLSPGVLTRVYLCPKTALFDPVIGLPENSSKIFTNSEESDIISIGNDKVKLQIDLSTGACISFKTLLHNEWVETLAQGDLKYRSDLPVLNPGILPQAYYEYSGVYAAWDLFPNSLHFPYPMKCKSANIISQDQGHIALRVDFELRTPPVEKLGGVKKKLFGAKNADQTGRRDPDVRPIFPSPDEYTDVSGFCFTYTLYPSDPKVYLMVETDFHAKDTMVKLNIPTSTQASRIISEIAYGWDNRSSMPTTSRDKGRWENLMHTWVDLPSKDKSWGFGVINEGKYGLGVHEGFMGLTLIRGKKFPAPFFNIVRKSWVGYERKKRKKAGQGTPPAYTSQGGHIWRFILYPHTGDHASCDLLQQAHLFNSPIMAYISKNAMDLGNSDQKSDHKFSLPTTDYPLEVSTLKYSHPDSDAAQWFNSSGDSQKVLIMRIVNWSKEMVTKEVKLNSLRVVEILECDLLERKLDNEIKSVKKDQFILSFKESWKPFEVKTFGLRLG